VIAVVNNVVHQLVVSLDIKTHTRHSEVMGVAQGNLVSHLWLHIESRWQPHLKGGKRTNGIGDQVLELTGAAVAPFQDMPGAGMIDNTEPGVQGEGGMVDCFGPFRLPLHKR